jgi:hypothetical protein
MSEGALMKPKWQIWTGRVLSALPVLLLLFSATMKVLHLPPVVEGFGKFGYPESMLTVLGVVEALCAILYVVPRTSGLGAVLCTGYLGGAVATHARIGDPSFVTPLILGIMVWGGLYLRDDRVRELLPLRKT